MRKRGLNTIYELAGQHQDILYIGSDVGQGTMADFQRDYPERFFVEGISEQHVIGMAAGLAMNGWKPFVNTIATFLTRRCYDQIAVDLCLGNVDVHLYANGGGLVYAPLGPTHQSIDDIALMRALPNMTVVCPSDAEEMARLVNAAVDHHGPLYIRVARGGDPVVSSPDHPFALGKAVVQEEPGDLLMVTTGVTRQIALGMMPALAQAGVTAGLVHVHTVKPLDTETLDNYLRKTRFVLSIEEHNVIGGLGSAVAERMAQGARHHKGLLKIAGINDRFPEGYGRQENLMASFGLDAESLTRETLTWMEQHG